MWWLAFALAADEPIPDEPTPDEPTPVESADGEMGPETLPVLEPPDCADTHAPGDAWPVQLATGPTVEALDAYLFPDIDRADKKRAGTRTDGVVIVHRGTIVYERYGADYTAEMPHLAWSVSKTFTNALIGIAVGEGKLSLDDSICDHIEVGNPDSCQVTVRHLMEFSTGWDWRETYEGQSPVNSSVLAMLYGEGRADMARFVTGHPFRDPPGTTWMYSSGDTNVLAAVAGAALAHHGDTFPWTVLFDPIGMEATWQRDGAGTYIGSSYLYATPRDQARFGQLWLDDGCWGDTRILPEGWVADSTQVAEALKVKSIDRGDGVQGRQVWLNRPVPEAGPTDPPWKGVPEDAYAALGHWKQSITVIPSHDLVVVRTGDDRDGAFDRDPMHVLAMQLVEAP